MTAHCSRPAARPSGTPRRNSVRLRAIVAAAAGGAVCLALYQAAAEPPSRTTAATSAARSSKETDAASRAAAPTYDSPQVAFINAEIRRGWRDHELQPSPAAPDGEWCRRVYLDIIGRIPTVAELDRFLADYHPDKKARLVDQLLSSQYSDEYAANWTTLWTNILIGRSGGTERMTRTNRDGMRQFLRVSFAANKPYDQLVGELISATGTSKPGTPGFNGAVNFLAMKLDEKAALAAAQTSQIFLGVRVQCTQCHDHPFNNWQQDQFWQFNSFFRQTAALRRFEGGRDIAYIELVDQDFGGEGDDPEEAEVYYEQRNNVLKVAYPVFTDVDGTKTELSKSGYVSAINRRKELAKLVVGSQYLPRAIANRMWAHFLGYGLTKPFDDLGPHNQPSHPELLERMATDFKAEGFDLKKLMRWIALSEPYSLSSRATKDNRGDDPTLGERPMFSHFYLRQMRAEELYNSLLVATEADKGRSAADAEAARRKWLGQFVIAFGTDENDETTTFNGTIPQTLMMFNGELVKRATRGEKGTLLERVASNPRYSANQKIDHLFKAALARVPTAQERTVATKLLRSRANPNEALADLWWGLLNTNEFILNH